MLPGSMVDSLYQLSCCSLTGRFQARNVHVGTCDVSYRRIFSGRNVLGLSVSTAALF